MVLSTSPHPRGNCLKRHSLDRTFAALSDPTRRGVVELLSDRPRRAGELAEELGSTAAGLSRHLRVLRESGLVVEETLSDDARVRIYRLQRTQFDALRTWVGEVETYWSRQLESFRDHVENRKKGKSR